MDCRMVMVAIVAVVAIGSIKLSEGQDIPACTTNVLPCIDFLNLTTKPPASCCDPLSQAVVKELTCLCNLYTTPSFFESYSINFTLAIRLPSLCGISTDLTTCIGGKNRTSSSFPASLAPPENDDDKGSTKNNAVNSSGNTINRNKLTVLLLSLLLFWISSSLP